MPDHLPNELLDFIARYIASLEKLEVLLALASEPVRSWNVEEMFHKVQSSRPSVQERLQELVNHGLAEQDSTNPLQYRFHPQTAQLTQATSQLAFEYRDRRLKVIEAILNKQDEQLRRFSDAFKLRKENP